MFVLSMRLLSIVHSGCSSVFKYESRKSPERHVRETATDISASDSNAVLHILRAA